MIVTISGDPGSGKSTVAEILANKFEAERVYAGGIFREMAKEKGMALEEFLKYTENHPEIHRQVDERIREKALEIDQEGLTAIVEGRVHFHFLPKSFKIFLKVSLDEAARRIWKDLNNKEASLSRNEEAVSSLQELKKKIKQRIKTDQERYRKLYHIDILDESQFDLVIDTTNLTPDRVIQEILDNFPL